MKRSHLLIAAGSAALAALVLYFLYRQPVSVAGAPQAPVVAANSASASASLIKPGFIGVAPFGAWRLICTADAAAPQTAPQNGSTAVDAATTVTNSCRVNQEIPFAGKPDQVLLAANFGIVGPMHRPALMLRLPSTAHAGDVVALRIDNSRTLRTPVRDCSETECLAATAISDDAWADLIAAGMVQIAFPIAANQRILVDVPMTGLDDATKAMNVAQTTPLGAPQKAGASGLAAPANPTQSVP